MRKFTRTVLIAVSLTLVAIPVNAAKLYKWVDQNGNVSYQDTPPPEGVDFQEKNIREDSDEAQTQVPVSENELANAVANSPVMLYTAPECEVCARVRAHLQQKQVPFRLRNIINDLEYQSELKEIAGRLEVPTLQIGEETLKGFNQDLIDRVLREAGYPENINADEAQALNEQIKAEEELRALERANTEDSETDQEDLSADSDQPDSDQ